MALRPFAGSCLTTEQLDAIGDAGVGTEDIVNLSCNTCELDAHTAIELYGLYDPERGQVLKWGEFNAPWDTPPSEGDSRWGFANLVSEFSYREGDYCVRLENEGLLVVIYQCIEDLPPFPGIFDSSKWEVLCFIKIVHPLNSLSYEELTDLYDYYDEDSTYDTGSYVLLDRNCQDTTCLYQSLVDDASNPLISPVSWSKLYCVPNGKPNSCKKPPVLCDKPGRKIVSLSSGGSDPVCIPVESLVGVNPPDYAEQLI